MQIEIYLTKRISGACYCKELTCLILEWVPKGSLGDMLNDKSLTLRWDEPLLKLATDIAQGTRYLHGHQFIEDGRGDMVSTGCIIHRDLKPDNCLVTEFIHGKLSDFGTSRVLESQKEVLMTATGTPLFTAPVSPSARFESIYVCSA